MDAFTGSIHERGIIMTEAQRDFVDYVENYAKLYRISVQDALSDKTVREVGAEYGLSEKEMDEVGR